MSEIIQVVTTIDRKESAEKIAEALVAGRLAACVQIVGPIESVYRWQGKVEKAQEWQCLAKTTQKHYPQVEAAILELHSYDVPEILVMPIVAGSKAYLRWLASEIEGPSS